MIKVYCPALHHGRPETDRMMVKEWCEVRGLNMNNVREIVVVGDGIFAVECFVRDDNGRIKIQHLDGGPVPMTCVVRVTDDGLPQWWP